VRQRPLDGVPFPPQRSRKGGWVGLERLETTGIERLQRGLATHDVKRGAFLRRRLREEQGSGREVERCETDLSGDLRALFTPTKTTGDHEMHHEPQVVRRRFPERKSDPFANTAHLRHPLAFDGAERWVERAHDERTRDASVLEHLADEPA